MCEKKMEDLGEQHTIEVWRIDQQRAVFLFGRTYNNRTTPYSFHDVKHQPDKWHPDPEMFPGSITEFLQPLPPSFFDDSEE